MCSDSVATRAENEVSGSSDDELIHLAYVSTQTRDMKAADLIGQVIATAARQDADVARVAVHWERVARGALGRHGGMKTDRTQSAGERARQKARHGSESEQTCWGGQ